MWQDFWWVWDDSIRLLPAPVLHYLVIGIYICFIVSMGNLWTYMRLGPSSVDPLGSPQVSWVVDMGLLPLVPQCHIFSVIPFTAWFILLLLLYPDTLWSTPFLNWLLCYWFLCRTWLHSLPCYTNGIDIDPKTSPIVCVATFSNILGVCKGILLSFWCVLRRISNFLYECCMVLLRPLCNLWNVHHTTPDLLLLSGSWSCPL